MIKAILDIRNPGQQRTPETIPANLGTPSELQNGPGVRMDLHENLKPPDPKLSGSARRGRPPNPKLSGSARRGRPPKLKKVFQTLDYFI